MNIELIKKNYDRWTIKKSDYIKAYEYYKGDTDAMKNYKMITERNNNKANTNFLKKFVKEEISYSVGNDITYISKSSNDSIVNDIDYYLECWKEDHDSILSKNMILYGLAYELYYISNKELYAKVISPRNAFTVKNEKDELLYFAHCYTLEDKDYIDVYDDKFIYHLDSQFNKVKDPTQHIFGMVPVGLAELSEEGIKDTIYNDIKGLQDSYETNLSDISNEISDFRTAYLKLINSQIDEEEAKEMKKMGIIITPKDGDVDWLVKNINDAFIQNTLNTLEDKMYQLTSHINHNEKMQSNTSSLALRSRLISLEEKCKLNQKALNNCIKTRLKVLFIYLKIMFNKNYDYRDIKIRFTPNIPQDDLMMAQIIAQLGDKLSTETGLSQLSFIENAKNELVKIKSEQESIIEGNQLLEEDDLDE
ncbi:phage portal protein [Paraclostridium bifermentans]|uniref:Phage portal protein n=1 Tax=Paraclostridium bifermentans TaxID=1490 RepID=A0A5P3XBM3_PARBF|nr:phage portal protein [Paraclostridium bifermentans]QEZ67740.1 phage portal protein [Paraclostridium bifermentans]